MPLTANRPHMLSHLAPFPAEQRELGVGKAHLAQLRRETQLGVKEPSRLSTPSFPTPTYFPSGIGYWPKKICFHHKKGYNGESSLLINSLYARSHAILSRLLAVKITQKVSREPIFLIFMVLEQWISNVVPRRAVFTIAQELVKDANSPIPPWTYCIRHLGVWAWKSVFEQASRKSWCKLKFENTGRVERTWDGSQET